MKTKKFKTSQLFSIVDGRLADSMDDVYDILGHLINDPLITTVALGITMDALRESSPEWFRQVQGELARMGNMRFGDGRLKDDFNAFINYVKDHDKEWDIPQLQIHLK